jgi:hypothetical protein
LYSDQTLHLQQISTKFLGQVAVLRADKHRPAAKASFLAARPVQNITAQIWQFYDF